MSNFRVKFYFSLTHIFSLRGKKTM